MVMAMQLASGRDPGRSGLNFELYRPMSSSVMEISFIFTSLDFLICIMQQLD